MKDLSVFGHGDCGMDDAAGKDCKAPKREKGHVAAAGDIERFFRHHKEDLGVVLDLAKKIRETIRSVDSFIQRHTSEVCPGCNKVCCINKHAYYERDDLIYIYALGLEPHGYEYREDDEPCQFLSARGCTLDRAVRPSGCNWFFCDALFDSMENTPGKAYADFDDSLRELAELWIALGSEFRTKFREIVNADLT